MTYSRNIKTIIKTQNSPEPSAYPHCINNSKNVAGYFKDVQTEEKLSSQDQKLVETTNSWQFYLDKKNSSAKLPVQLPLTQLELNKWIKMSTLNW